MEPSAELEESGCGMLQTFWFRVDQSVAVEDFVSDICSDPETSPYRLTASTYINLMDEHHGISCRLSVTIKLNLAASRAKEARVKDLHGRIAVLVFCLLGSSKEL